MDIQSLLGDQADDLLGHVAKAVPAEDLILPGPDYIDRVLVDSDRSPQVLRNLASLFGHGRLGGTGYVSILPVDQGVEHSAAASFAPNPAYFDPKNIVELAIEGGCNAVATTFGVLGAVSRRYAHRIPFIAKLNHNELLTLPNQFDQIMFGSVEVGNYFYNEHMLVKGVRDGARFAARQAFTNYAGCTSTPSDVGDPVASNTKLVVRKGSLDSTVAAIRA